MKYRLDRYGNQISQLSYGCMRFSRKGSAILQAAAEKGIPVIIMEPLCGGKLVDLPDKAKEVLASDSKGYTPAELGLRREPSFASQCIGCDKCEKHCPQTSAL